MSQEGFHEIQLNGKQLVFLFMAATVVSVVIFLCGVMVGRGVRAERGDAVAATPVIESAPPPATDAPAPAPAAEAAPPAGPAGAPAAAARGDDESGYYDQLVGNEPVEKSMAPGARREPAPAPPPDPAPAPADPAPAAAAATPPAADRGPAGEGFAVQLAALRDRAEADAIVRRLVGKGYPAYVLNPSPGSAPVYRVQVGRFQNRADADATARRLQKEEQFSPWVTR